MQDLIRFGSTGSSNPVRAKTYEKHEGQDAAENNVHVNDPTRKRVSRLAPIREDKLHKGVVKLNAI